MKSVKAYIVTIHTIKKPRIVKTWAQSEERAIHQVRMAFCEYAPPSLELSATAAK